MKRSALFSVCLILFIINNIYTAKEKANEAEKEDEKKSGGIIDKIKSIFKKEQKKSGENKGGLFKKIFGKLKKKDKEEEEEKED